MIYMDLQKYMLDVKIKDIQEALEVCVNKYEREAIYSQRYIVKVIQSMKEWIAYTPGDKVQVDIKYVPEECVRFPSYGDKYYQITAIDEYSRKRMLKIVKEKSICKDITAQLRPALISKVLMK